MLTVLSIISFEIGVVRKILRFVILSPIVATRLSEGPGARMQETSNKI